MRGERVRQLLTTVRMRTDVRRYAMRVLDALGRPPLAEDDGSIGVRTLAVGPDPVRVLVIGAGLAVGYGVRERAEAFDGPFVDLLSARLRRGVVLDNRAVQHVRTADIRRLLGSAGTHTFRLVIWCPSFMEGLDRVSLRSWRRDLVELVEQLRAEQSTSVLLTHMPVPSGLHPKALLARPWVHRINRMIAGVAAGDPHLLDVATEPFFAAEVGVPVTSPEYFERVARRLVDASVRLLDPAALAASSR